MNKFAKKSLYLFILCVALIVCIMATFFSDSGKIQVAAADAPYIAGDINGDGKVNGKDVTRLIKFLSGVDVDVLESMLDVNQDGSIGNNDVTHLLKYIAGEIPELVETVYYSVDFNDDLTDYNKTVYYKVSEGLKNSEFPKLTSVGRVFLGWSTEPNDKNSIIDSIPKGSNQKYDLYACWDYVEYTITYRYKEDDIDNYVVNTNKTTYTIQDEFEFENPTLSGLRFSHWTVGQIPETGEISEYVDITGAKRMKLNRGTTGNIVLVANWKSYENLVVPVKDYKKVAIDYDSENDFYYFIYELGTIENVVLDSDKNAYKYHKTNNNPSKRTISETLTIEMSRANEITNTVAESVMKYYESSDFDEFVHNTTEVNGREITTGFDIGKEKIFQFKIEGHGYYEFREEDGWKHSESTTSGKDFGMEVSENISSTVLYREELTTTNEVSYDIKEDAPLGNYYFVHASDIKVFAFVVYTPADKKLYLDTYSIIDNTHSVLLYEPSGYNDFETEKLSYNIDHSDIIAKIESGYYIKYDPNTGTGKMNLSVFNNDKDNYFAENKYVKTGHHLVGWKNEEINNGKLYLPYEKVTDALANPGETITMYAQWMASDYKVTFDCNGGTAETVSKIVTYGSKYGELPEPVRDGYEFTGWLLDGNKIDKDTIVSTASDHTLTAAWEPKIYTVVYNLSEESVKNKPICSKQNEKIVYASEDVNLAIPECYLYTFEGWYSDKGEKISGKEGIVLKWNFIDADENGIINLYARWSTIYTFISNRADLEKISENLDGEYALDADIDLSGSAWGAISDKFTGTFDGNGYTISGLTKIADLDKTGIKFGLFEELSGATISNVTFTEIDILLANKNSTSSEYAIGALAGVAENSEISNVVVSGSISFKGGNTGYSKVGGVVGRAISSNFLDCSNYADIWSEKGESIAGGIVGFATIYDTENSEPCNFEKCKNYGTIVARVCIEDGAAYSGGIAGKDRYYGSFFDIVFEEIVAVFKECNNYGSVELKGTKAGTYEKDDIRN